MLESTCLVEFLIGPSSLVACFDFECLIGGFCLEPSVTFESLGRSGDITIVSRVIFTSSDFGGVLFELFLLDGIPVSEDLGGPAGLEELVLSALGCCLELFKP